MRVRAMLDNADGESVLEITHDSDDIDYIVVEVVSGKMTAEVKIEDLKLALRKISTK